MGDVTITQLLAQYGKCVGPVRHGYVKLPDADGTRVATGVRFASFLLKPGCTIPSYLTLPSSRSQIRIFYNGQIQTCKVCAEPGHLARDCPRASRTQQSTRGWERQMEVGTTKPTDTVQDREDVDAERIPASATTEHAPLTPHSVNNDKQPENDQQRSNNDCQQPAAAPSKETSEIDQPLSVSSTSVQPPTPPEPAVATEQGQPPTTTISEEPGRIEQLLESARHKRCLNQGEHPTLDYSRTTCQAYQPRVFTRNSSQPSQTVKEDRVESQ